MIYWTIEFVYRRKVTRCVLGLSGFWQTPQAFWLMCGKCLKYVSVCLCVSPFCLCCALPVSGDPSLFTTFVWVCPCLWYTALHASLCRLSCQSQLLDKLLLDSTDVLTQSLRSAYPTRHIDKETASRKWKREWESEWKNAWEMHLK